MPNKETNTPPILAPKAAITDHAIVVKVVALFISSSLSTSIGIIANFTGSYIP